MNIYMKPNAEFKYPYYYGDIKLEHPRFQPGDVPPEGWLEVKDVSPPKVDKYQVLEELEPKVVDGELSRAWKVRDMTDEEVQELNTQEVARQKLKDAGLSDLEIESLILKAR